MPVRDQMAAQTATTYLDVFHPSVGHVAIRSLSEYERSCLENSIAGESRKKTSVTKDRWLLSAKAKLLMFTMCEPEFLYDPANPGKSIGPNPDAFKPAYTTVLDQTTGTIMFDKDQLASLLKTNGAITNTFVDPAMKHTGMSSTDFEELLGNSETTSNSGS